MSSAAPTFATNADTGVYYEKRAKDFDDWYTGQGRFADHDRPGWHGEVDQLVALLQRLSSVRTLDVACGTGFLTQHLSGYVVGIDQSPSMVAIAQSRLPNGLAILGDALNLAVADQAFDRVLTGHFYGHLPPDERAVFLSEVRRVANELIVIDAALRPGVDPEQWQERELNDGSNHHVYKRYLRGDQLAAEIGGRALFDGQWFVVAQANWS